VIHCVIGIIIQNSERANGTSKFRHELTAPTVDDDKLVRMIHRGLLKRAGVKSEAVKNGKEAVDIHCSGQRFDIILMDKEMPVMNGIEVHSYIITYVNNNSIKALFILIPFSC
jgi:CheY-like chemotaxis protein